MFFAKKIWIFIRTWKAVSTYGLALVCFFLSLVGCGPQLSSSEQVGKFERAGPLAVEEHIVGLGGVRHRGPYRVVPGDILEFQMPVVLRVISSEFSEWLRPIYGHKDVEPYLVRVSDSGTITLPIVGELPAGGRTLSQIEALVIDAYHPKYVVLRSSHPS